MKMKQVISNAFDAMLASYEGKRFVPSLVLRLIMALASAVVTAVFANTLFSRNSVVNQIFSALFFYFLMVSVSKLITEIRRGGAGRRFCGTVCNMFRLNPPALWFFIAAVLLSLILPYAFVLAFGLLLFCSALSEKNSLLLGIKNAVTRGKHPEKNGRGLAAFACGLLVCGLIIGILSHLGVPTLYGVIDGAHAESDTAQTEHTGRDDGKKPDTQPGTDMPSRDSTSAPDTAPDTDGTTDVTTDDRTPAPDGSTVVSGDTDITEAAQILTDRLIAYAGSDRQSLAGLFRNTDASVIDQYYNASLDAFREYDHCLIAVAAQDYESVWFTALYYRIPEGYPAEREDTVYLSTIMTRADDGWKLEWNDDVQSRLIGDYTDAGLTYGGREAMNEGCAWAKFFIPFDLYTAMIYYDNAVMCKATEMYIDRDGNLQITLYISNGTDSDIAMNGVDITLTDGGATLFSCHFDFDLYVDRRNVSVYNLTVPAEELDFDTWSRPIIDRFSFTYEKSEY